jgi:hypothetical protein
MPSRRDPDAVQRLRIAFDLYDAGVSLMRARLRREHPDEDETAIERRLAQWLHTRPGAEHGDGEGRLREPDPRGDS